METKLCRICGKTSQNYVHIFKTEGLQNKIETCLPIVVSPHCLLPDTICRECSDNVDNFYSFIKNCLQNIIILEAQYDIQESCLKTKRKKEKSCLVCMPTQTDSKSIQTEDYLDILLGKKLEYEALDLKFPSTTSFLDKIEKQKKSSTILVDYDIDSDNSDQEDKNSNGKVISEKQKTLNKLNDFVEVILMKKRQSNIKPGENSAENEIKDTRGPKRKGDIIETSCSKIFKLDSSSRRKCRQPKKVEKIVVVEQKENNEECDILEPIDMQEVEDNFELQENEEKCNGDLENEQNMLASTSQNVMLTSLTQTCLLCDTQFNGPVGLATHIFEHHGLDMSEAVSLGSGEFSVEKKKKTIPNLVKISDLKRSDSMEDCPSGDQQQEEPPMLLPSFVCPNCPAIFTCKNDLMLHLRLKHSDQAAYLCGLCLLQTNSYVNLKNHLVICSQNHTISAKYICQICKYADDNFKWLENHVLVHGFLLENCRKEGKMYDPAEYIDTNENCENSGSKNWVCSECDEGGYESYKDFSEHRRNKHSIFHCDLCTKFYGRNSHLWKHVNRLHKGHPSITCQLCLKTSASKYHLTQHFAKIHNAKGLRNEEDDFLSQKFDGFDFQSVKQSFLRQELAEQGQKFSDNDDNMSDNEESQQEAKIAPKEIDSSHDLYTNIITNYTPPANEGEFKCPKCSKAFHKRVLLKKHKKNCRPRLQKDLLTRCKSCARVFKDRQSLAKHLVNYHSEYVCEICSEKVQSKCEIISHIRFQHPGCHLVCSMCRNILRSEHDLQVHSEDHANSYVCQFCGDALPSKIKLKMHILSLHRKILSLSCGICLKLFETQHVLRDHVTLVHKDELDPLTSCTVCGKNYGSKWKTYDHLNKSHGRTFKACRICLDVFDSEAGLESHCLTIHNATQHPPIKNTNSSQSKESMVHDNYESEHETEESDSEEEEEDEESKPPVGLSVFSQQFMHDEKISLLEKRLLGKKVTDEDAVSTQENLKRQILANNSFVANNMLLTMQNTNATTHKDPPTHSIIKKEDYHRDSSSSPPNSQNPQCNSSKRTVYVNSNDPSFCEICKKTWPAKKHLWQHYIRCHKSVAATVCGICLQTNPNYMSLQLHLRKTHPNLLHGQGFGSNFICRICGRYHNASSKLKLHMVIHENFDWGILENLPPLPRAKMLPKPENNRKFVCENGFQIKTELDIKSEDYNSINYESMIEQVECSSQSENEESEIEEDAEVKNELQSSSDEDDSSSSYSEEGSVQRKMYQNILNSDERPTKPKEEYLSSDNDSSSTISDENVEDSRLKTEESEEEDECLPDSRDTFPIKSEVIENIFERKPEELDSAIKSISYECLDPVDDVVEVEFCEIQANCLNENEIESAVGSIL